MVRRGSSAARHLTWLLFLLPCGFHLCRGDRLTEVQFAAGLPELSARAWPSVRVWVEGVSLGSDYVSGPGHVQEIRIRPAGFPASQVGGCYLDLCHPACHPVLGSGGTEAPTKPAFCKVQVWFCPIEYHLRSDLMVHVWGIESLFKIFKYALNKILSD